MKIRLTEAAARHMGEGLARRGKGVGVRFGVQSTSCAGFTYKLEYVDQIDPADVVVEQHGIKLMVEPASLALVDGTALDYANDGFSFDNPNEQGRCGCDEPQRA